MSGHVLELENVTKRFGDFTAVDDVSLSIPRGSIYGFLGPNGAGKTTTIRMIFDIIKPTSGYISILGASSALAVRRRIGYLPEEKGLYKAMTAVATVAYFASLKGLSRKTAKERAYSGLLKLRFGFCQAFITKAVNIDSLFPIHLHLTKCPERHLNFLLLETLS